MVTTEYYTMSELKKLKTAITGIRNMHPLLPESLQ